MDRPYSLETLHRIAHPILLLNPQTEHGANVTLGGLYKRLVDRCGEQLVNAVRSIARHDGGVLVHCTAGKDRTGMVTALTLLSLGVDRQVVLDDYALTHANLVGEWTDRFLSRHSGGPQLPKNLLEVLNGSPTDVLDRALDRIDQEYLGPREYLRAHGLSDADFMLLRRRLVTPALATPDPTTPEGAEL